ncbi:MAG: lipoyl synthase [Gammaproteobacteria bacterium]|nr:lipoyl synthase [Gammaproteobacteria bacterium]
MNDPHRKQKGADKTDRIPVKVEVSAQRLPKPRWIRVRASSMPEVTRLKALLREHKLHTVCEEASCPNLGECFSHGTATFMIMGELCTRRCPFCDVGHGRPLPLDESEPEQLADAVQLMDLRYVVITSVDRDDLRDGGAGHFARCIAAVRARVPEITIEILVPDFRGRMEKAIDALSGQPPDIFNHNLETAPRLYKSVRPGADYAWSLRLIQEFKRRHPRVPTKSGIMVGLGESDDEVIEVMQDLHAHDCEMLTIGQYLQPGPHHLPVQRYVRPEQFEVYAKRAREIGFRNVASGPLVRSSYHADQQAADAAVI